ncbi:hypothetical protein NIES4106_29550 [Fischerella sp. NIES-4106]|nr:hypothetical protein NIES4106_29550 [Fischerella sp. NIES-4106]
MRSDSYYINALVVLPEKTMTQVIDELIDSLKISEVDKNSTTPLRVKPTV